MTAWRPQLYLQRGKEKEIDTNVLQNATAIGQSIVSIHAELPPIFTLKHLSVMTGVSYGFLRSVVSRSHPDPYRTFKIHKRPEKNGRKRYRIICAPQPELSQAQRWISQRILTVGQPHSASTAYAKGDNVIAGAQPHCSCRWLIKLDVCNFFESINEIAVYRVFRSLGYQPLVAFELTRISTRLGSGTALRTTSRWRVDHPANRGIQDYMSGRMGHLPQGAPTSPMLANLAVREFDVAVASVASAEGLIYTRYADDITLSTTDNSFNRVKASRIVGMIFQTMSQFGLSPNVSKTTISTPGSRKVVLGLLVDGPTPRLTRAYKSTIRQHLHYLTRKDIGPHKHAVARGFSSIIGLRHHVHGLITYAKQVEPVFGQRCLKQFKTVVWPI